MGVDSGQGIWVHVEDGEITLNSLCRFGQFVFENGGVLDEYVGIGSFEDITDFVHSYCGDEVFFCSDQDYMKYHEPMFKEAFQEYLDKTVEEINAQ